MESLVTLVSSYLLIGLAELGDKSQFVCLVLAARHRPTTVFFAAALALGLLNAIAVIFGAALANWLPTGGLEFLVGLIFLAFGVQMLIAAHDEAAMPELPSKRHVFFSAFLLILISELGDKTQLAVVGLSATASPLYVWLGATAALVTTSALGVWAGSRLQDNLRMKVVHRIGGVLFLLFGVLACYAAYQALAARVL